jgi:hypothetical protein
MPDIQHKDITVVDSLKTDDVYDIKNMKKPVTLLRGHVTWIDNETGNIIVDKDNLIVMRGRTFALEKMFGQANTLEADYNTQNLDGKKICLFKVGNGGCVDGQPFNVLPVIPSDCRELGNEIPFRLVFDGEDKPDGYYDVKTVDEAAGTRGYYAKTFDNLEWTRELPDGTNPEDTDEICVKLTLQLTEDDFKTVPEIDENGLTEYNRHTFVNELGLCIANQVKNDVTDRMDNIELATRICFESEPYMNATKSSTIYYYIYA